MNITTRNSERKDTTEQHKKLKRWATLTHQKNQGWTQVLAKGKQFLLFITHPLCYSYIVNSGKSLGSDSGIKTIIPSYVRSAISWRVCASGLINPKSYFYVSSKFLKMHIPSFCHQSVPRSKVFVSVSILANTRHYTIKKLFSLDQLYMLIQGLFLLI